MYVSINYKNDYIERNVMERNIEDTFSLFQYNLKYNQI